jgi:hypothetical protein
LPDLGFRFCAYGISAAHQDVRHRRTTPRALCLLRTYLAPMDARYLPFELVVVRDETSEVLRKGLTRAADERGQVLHHRWFQLSDTVRA